MLRKQLLLASLLLFSCSAHAQLVKQPYYYQIISNDDKTVDFVIGLYTATIQYFDDGKFPAYTCIKGAVINQSHKDDLKWNDFKINILLKSGTLIRNYLPNSPDGVYACNYTVPKDSTHYQFFCFHSKFLKEDVDKVWLMTGGDDQIFSLRYDENDK